MTDAAYEAITRARNQASSGNPNGAVETLEGYLATDPHNTKPRMVLAEVAINYLKDREYGMLQLDIILDLEPDNTDALKAKVTLLAPDKKNNEETKELFERLVVACPSAEVYNDYGRFLRNQILDFKLAGEYYAKAIALDPGNYVYHQNYAVVLLNDLKDYVTAKRELEILMEMKPMDQSIRKNYDKLMTKKFDKNGNPKTSWKDKIRK